MPTQSRSSINNNLNEDIAAFQNYWKVLFPAILPPDQQQWGFWLLRHHPSVVREGLCKLAARYRDLQGAMTAEYMAKHLSSTANRLTCESEKRRPETIHMTREQWASAFRLVAENYASGPATEDATKRALDLLEVLTERPDDFWDSYLTQPVDEDGLAARLLHKHGPDITWKQMRDAVAAEFKVEPAPADRAQ